MAINDVAAASEKKKRTGSVVVAVATVAVAALITTLAVVWPGMDAREIPLNNGSVWALQTGDGNRYARVNVALGELDTVKRTESPTRLLQNDDQAFVLSNGTSRLTPIDAASPSDIDAESEDSLSTPPGTVSLVSSGDYAVFLSDSGEVKAGHLGTENLKKISPLSTDPSPAPDVDSEESSAEAEFVADAVTVTSSGTVFAYSEAEALMLSASASTGEVLSQTPLLAEGEEWTLSAAGDKWALINTENGMLWLPGQDQPVSLGNDSDLRLQSPGLNAEALYFADETGLKSVSFSTGAIENVFEQDFSGFVPAAPRTQTVVEGQSLGVVAAWLSEASESGFIWSTRDGLRNLEYNDQRMQLPPNPVLSGNSHALIVNDTVSGWVWDAASAALVPSSQSWDIDQSAEQNEQEREEVQQVVDPKPPVAVPDSFGVRAGRSAVLPVLLNDHDPNDDVLTIVPSSVTGLAPEFGSITVDNDNQQLVVTVRPDAPSTATFNYQLSDGTADKGGRLSNVTTVSLEVIPESENRAPVWCGVAGCLATWPEPNVANGGTITSEVLNGWVDPDGDPIMLAAASVDPAAGQVLTDPSGSVTYQHPDPSATGESTVPITLTVQDTLGAKTDQLLNVKAAPVQVLKAEPFSAVGVVGQVLSVSLNDFIEGANGDVSVTGATILGTGSERAQLGFAADQLSITASSAGDYLVEYTVSNGQVETSGNGRFSIVESGQAQLAIAPLTAFVRPGEDATVSVMDAATNPAARVLLLSDLKVTPHGDNSLNVDVLDHQLLRVSGSTADGEAGVLGVVEYLLSDGSDNALAQAHGELTVMLLEESDAQLPIAVNDSVLVRVGAQIDIPVLDNDVAPPGVNLAVDPSSIVNEFEDGLAFATARSVRYLAPDKPGSYAVSYSIFRMGAPELKAQARVLITVVDNEGNASPTAPVLEGRVLSGKTVSIPFNDFKVDPNGDNVFIDRVVTQPQFGTATVSAESNAILYTSHTGAGGGNDSFEYRIKDTQGATATGTVRIGILNETLADPAPVAASDYVQIQLGEDNEALLDPTLNDLDPAGEALQLVDVFPFAEAGTPEYDYLRSLIKEVDLEENKLRLGAGTELGTFSFNYIVENESGSSATGVIVLKVVRGAVPEFPQVKDTILTALTRDSLAQGVDVLSDRVSWVGGDASTLVLSLWRDTPGFRVEGSRIFGEAPDAGALIPFEVRGTAFDGREVVSYGFLRIPARNEIQLSLKPGRSSIEVRETESAQLDLASAVSYPPDEEFVVDAASVRASGSRSEGQCQIVSGTVLRYQAGLGAPWSDSCSVSAKLVSQDSYTTLVVPVYIEAENSQPVLSPGAITVSPGASASFDLGDMVSWTGTPDPGALRYTTSYSGSLFTVTTTGSQVTVSALDASIPSRRESVQVKVSSFPDAAPAALNLTVGPAPAVLPKGGTATARCSQENGNVSCDIPVIGAAGEVNPLPNTPLVLNEVISPANCPAVTFSALDNRTVRASWAADAPGRADCTGRFTVKDAQGRVSSGARSGQIILDLQGLPDAPSRAEWLSVSPNSVTLGAVPAGTSYPSVKEYVVRSGGADVAKCSASGVCERIGGLALSASSRANYEIWAVNDVGISRTSANVTAWPYGLPPAPQRITAVPVPSENSYRVKVDVSGIHASTKSIRLSGSANSPDPVRDVGSSLTASFEVSLDSPDGVLLKAYPITNIPEPPAGVQRGDETGQSADVTAYAIGKPEIELALEATTVGSSGSITANINVLRANAGVGTMNYGFSLDSAQACTPDSSSPSRTFSGLTVWEETTIYACAASVYNGTTFPKSALSKSAMPTGTIAAPSGTAQYSVDRSYRKNNQTFTWDRVHAPSLQVQNDRFVLRYSSSINSSKVTDFTSLFNVNSDPGTIQAFSCLADSPEQCSAPVVIQPTGAAYTVEVTMPANNSCVRELDGEIPKISGLPTNESLYSSQVSRTDDLDLRYELSWLTRLAGLDPIANYIVTCSDPPEPEEDDDDDDEEEDDTSG